MSSDDREILLQLQKGISELTGMVNQYIRSNEKDHNRYDETFERQYARIGSLEISRGMLYGIVIGSGVLGGAIGAGIQRVF